MHKASKILTIGLLITTMPIHAATAASTKDEYYDCFFQKAVDFAAERTGDERALVEPAMKIFLENTTEGKRLNSYLEAMAALAVGDEAGTKSMLMQNDSGMDARQQALWIECFD
jgi:hypothetical protein